MNRNFLVGITPDLFLAGNGTAEDLFAEEFGLIAGLDYREMDIPAGNVATPDLLRLFDAVICLNMRITAESLAGVDQLSIVARWGMRCENLDMEALTQAGIAVTTSPESVKRPEAESIFGLILALAKNVVQQDRAIRGGQWRDALATPGTDLRGHVLGSIGCGAGGREMFHLAQAFGFRCLLSYDPHRSQSDVVDLGVELVDLETLCRESDFLVVNAPLTPETKGVLGYRQFRMMKPAAYYIHTSSAPIAEPSVLAEALRDGWIAGAALPSFPGEEELDNVILVPHSVAWTDDLMHGTCKEACRNILQVGRGEVPDALVNRSLMECAKFRAKLDHHRVHFRL